MFEKINTSKNSVSKMCDFYNVYFSFHPKTTIQGSTLPLFRSSTVDTGPT